MTGLKGFLSALFGDITKDTVFVRQNDPVTYTHMYKNIIFKTSINIVNIVCESITILIPRLNPLV